MCRMNSLLHLLLLPLSEVISFHFQDQKPTYLVASASDDVVLNCKIDFPQNVPISYGINWRHEGKTVYSWSNGIGTSFAPFIGRMHLVDHATPYGHHFGKASVNLTSVRSSDSGWFQCQVYFPNRTPNVLHNGTWYHLAVKRGRLLAIPPINQTVLEGERVKFPCLTKDPDLRVTWYKDGVSLRKFHDLLRRSYVTKENTLVMKAAVMGDGGEYRCTVSKRGKEKQTASAFLNVQYKARVIFTPSEVKLKYGAPGMIDCSIRANPPLTRLYWKKDGCFLDPYNVRDAFYKRNGSLYFTRVDERHGGIYSCTPFNKLGTQGPSLPIIVTVVRPPLFTIVPRKSYFGKLAATISLPCDAIDDGRGHRPLILWRKMEGATLSVERYVTREGNLTIFDLQEEDSGRYQCSATNEVATIAAETQLFVGTTEPNETRNSTSIYPRFSVHLIPYTVT